MAKMEQARDKLKLKNANPKLKSTVMLKDSIHKSLYYTNDKNIRYNKIDEEYFLMFNENIESHQKILNRHLKKKMKNKFNQMKKKGKRNKKGNKLQNFK